MNGIKDEFVIWKYDITPSPDNEKYLEDYTLSFDALDGKLLSVDSQHDKIVCWIKHYQYNIQNNVKRNYKFYIIPTGALVKEYKSKGIKILVNTVKLMNESLIFHVFVDLEEPRY